MLPCPTLHEVLIGTVPSLDSRGTNDVSGPHGMKCLQEQCLLLTRGPPDVTMPDKSLHEVLIGTVPSVDSGGGGKEGN